MYSVFLGLLSGWAGPIWKPQAQTPEHAIHTELGLAATSSILTDSAEQNIVSTL